MKALGKKATTTVRSFTICERERVFPSVSGAEKSGAVVPTSGEAAASIIITGAMNMAPAF